jgi:hypothetical protein
MGKIAKLFSVMHPVEKLFLGMWALIALIFFGFAAWQAIGSFRIISTHEKALAEVRSCNTSGGPGGKFALYRCEVKYQSVDGRHSASVDKLLVKYDEGDKIDIYYSTGPEYSVKAGGFVGLWGLPTLLSVIGCIFIGFGLWPIRKSGD